MKHSSITVGNYYNWRPNELNLGKLDIYKMQPLPSSSHNLLSENYNKISNNNEVKQENRKMIRYFAVAKGWEDKGVNLPQRSTENSAGYDFESAEDIVIPSIWKTIAQYFKGEGVRPTIVQTGVKAYMNDDEVLEIYVRSSSAIKKFLTMPNNVGIIDSDYVDNPKNDGAIGIPLWNFGLADYHVKKGERIAQGIFVKFLKVDDDYKSFKSPRTGGVGSTDSKL